jgi:hypothetical protein
MRRTHASIITAATVGGRAQIEFTIAAIGTIPAVAAGCLRYRYADIH